MENLEVTNYIKNAIAQGQDLAQIRAALTQNGWADQDITEAIVQSGVTQNQAGVPQTPQQESPLPGQVPTTTFSQPKPSSEKRTYYIVALSIALAILLIGGGVFAYFILPTPSNNTILNEAIANQFSLHTVKILSTITFLPNNSETTQNTQEPLQKPLHYTLHDNTSLDFNDVSNTKTSSQITVSATSTTQQYSFSFNMRTIGSVYYFEITKLPSELAAYPSTALYTNRWFKINLNKIDTLFPSTQSIKIQKQKAEIIRVQNDIKKLFKKSTLFVVSKNLGDESVGSVNSYHYRIAIDKTAAEQFFTSTIQIIKKDAPSIPISPEKIVKMKKSFNQIVTLLNNPKVINMEIWISKNKHFIIKGLLTVIPNKEMSKISGTFLNIPPKTPFPFHALQFPLPKTFSFNTILSAQNAPMHISTPLQSTSLMQLILQSLSVARQKGNRAAVLADFSTIATEAVLYYSDNNSYGHTRSKTNGGVCEEATIARIMQDMKTVFGNVPGNSPVCTTNATRYSPATNFTVYLKFPNGHYFCLDSNNGASKDIGTSLASYRAGVSCGG